MDCTGLNFPFMSAHLRRQRGGHAQTKTRGFSFIELLAASAILAILATVAVPVVQTTIKRQKEQDLSLALTQIRVAIDAYKQAADAHRITTLGNQSGYPPSLNDLVLGAENPSDPSGPKLYFLRRIPRDPFFPDTTTAAGDTWGKRSFDSPPDAPRAGNDVFDVYSLSSGSGLNGVPYAEW